MADLLICLAVWRSVVLTLGGTGDRGSLLRIVSVENLH